MKPKAILMFMILLAACSSMSSEPTATLDRMESARRTMAAAGEIPTETPTFTRPEDVSLPTLTPTFTQIASAGGPEQRGTESVNSGACVPPGAPVELGLVLDVIDSVTILVSIDGQEQRVRYIGLEPPGDLAYRPYAIEKNFELTINQVIMLVKDVSEQDKSQNLLRYVFIPDRSGIFLNYELVRQGYALAVPAPPDSACSETFRLAQERARYDLEGLWGPTPIPSSTANRPLATYTRPSASTDCHPSYPTVCIPAPPPYLDCGKIVHHHFPVVPPDPHGFDSDGHDSPRCRKEFYRSMHCTP